MCPYDKYFSIHSTKQGFVDHIVDDKLCSTIMCTTTEEGTTSRQANTKMVFEHKLRLENNFFICAETPDYVHVCQMFSMVPLLGKGFP